MACGVIAASLLAGPQAAAPVLAKSAAGQPATLAQADRAVTFNIPAQPLSRALTAFGRQAGLQVAVDTAAAAGLTSSRLFGTMLPGEALTRLLAGTGLNHRFTSATAVSVEPPGQSGTGSLQLGPVLVQGPAETAWGPIDGYVATRSATGSKSDTPVSEIPQAISVVTRDQMTARGVTTVGEALSYTAGVTTGGQGDSSGLGGDNIAIRGFGGNGTAGASFNEYWDGLRMLGTNYAIAGIDPYLFERIDVLKGPSSVLYGQNQPGGVVNHVSKRPPSRSQGQVEVKAGSFETYGLDADVGGPLTNDGTLSYRAVGVIADGEAQTDYTGHRRTALAPSLEWRPTTDTTLTLLTTYQHDDIDGGFVKYVPSQGSVFSNPNGSIPRERFTGDPNYDEWDRSLFSAGYLLEHRFDSLWTVRQSARYTRNELDLKAVYLASLQSDLRTINRSAFGAVESADAYTLDNQAEARFTTGAVRHTALLGIDVQRLESDTLRRFASAPTLDLYNPVYHRTIDDPPVYQSTDYARDQVGLYAQDQIKLDQWILTLGGRQDWTDDKTTNNLTGVDTDSNAQAFTGRVGLGYAFANGITPYASYAESFEPNAGLDFEGSRFEPTTGTQFEVGVKYQPTGVNAFVTLAAFHLTQQNVLTSDPVNTGFSVQTGEVRSRGIEVEGVASLAEGWNLTASYTYLDQEVTKSNDANLGKRLTGIPEHSASLWSAYEFGTGDFAGLGLGAGVRYVGSTAGDTSNSFEVPSVTLFDAALSYDLGGLDTQLVGWQAAVNAQNLMDKDYVASCSSTVRCYYGIGRTVIARLTYSW